MENVLSETEKKKLLSRTKYRW